MCHPPHPAPGINSIKTYYHIACTECSDARMNTDTKIFFYLFSPLSLMSREKWQQQYRQGYSSEENEIGFQQTFCVSGCFGPEQWNHQQNNQKNVEGTKK